MEIYQKIIKELIEKIDVVTSDINTQNNLIAKNQEEITYFIKFRENVEKEIFKTKEKIKFLEEYDEVVPRAKKTHLIKAVIKLLITLLITLLALYLSPELILELIIVSISGLSGLAIGAYEYAKYYKATITHRKVKENNTIENLESEIEVLAGNNLRLSKTINRLIANEYALKDVLKNLLKHKEQLKNDVIAVTQKRNEALNNNCAKNNVTDLTFEKDTQHKDTIKLERVKHNGENVWTSFRRIRSNC